MKFTKAFKFGFWICFLAVHFFVLSCKKPKKSQVKNTQNYDFSKSLAIFSALPHHSAVTAKDCFLSQTPLTASKDLREVATGLNGILQGERWLDSITMLKNNGNINAQNVSNVYKARAFFIACSRLQWQPKLEQGDERFLPGAPQVMALEGNKAALEDAIEKFEASIPHFDYPVASFAIAENARHFLNSVFPNYKLKLNFEVVGPYSQAIGVLTDFDKNQWSRGFSKHACKIQNLEPNAAQPLINLIGSQSWAEFQIKNVKYSKENLSYLTQVGRAALALCAYHLYDFVTTGSSRGLVIKRETALKIAQQDIDTSGPSEKMNHVVAFMKRMLPSYTHTLEMDFLVDPIESLHCRNYTDLNEFLACEKTVSQLSVEVMLQNSLTEHAEKGFGDYFVNSNQFCRNGFSFTETLDRRPLAALILKQQVNSDFSDVLLRLDQKTDYGKYLNFMVLRQMLGAIKQPAYYLSQDAMVKWVVEREDIFREKLDSINKFYAKEEVGKKYRRSAATLEQLIKAFHKVAYSPLPKGNGKAEITNWYYTLSANIFF